MPNALCAMTYTQWLIPKYDSLSFDVPSCSWRKYYLELYQIVLDFVERTQNEEDYFNIAIRLDYF